MVPGTADPEADRDLPVFIILRQLKDGPCYDFRLEIDGGAACLPSETTTREPGT